MTISKSQILDLSRDILETEMQKKSSFIVSEFDRILPIFELDHEVLLLEIQKSELEFNGEINMPFGSILKVYPLTDKAKILLSGKLNQSIEISAPIFEGVIEQVKLKRSIDNRKLLFNKLTKICLIQEKLNPVFSQSVQSTVELLLKNQSVGNSYLANLIQYNYNPNEISSGNIEFLEKIGIIAWITKQSSNEGYTSSNYFKQCEAFKLKINEGNYAAGFETYLKIIEDENLDFKNSHDKINKIINESQIEIDLFKVSYYFLALKTKLNKNNSNLLELFEEMIHDVHSDKIAMAYVLYLISFSFSFEQLYESIHILEKSVLVKSKFIKRDAKTIFHDLAIEDEKLENQRILKEREQIMRDEHKLHQEELEEKKKIEEEEKESDLENERINLVIQSHESSEDKNSQSIPIISDNKKEEIEIGKTIELSLFENTEVTTLVDLNNSVDSIKNDYKNSNQQERNPKLLEPSTEYQNSKNNELINNNQVEGTELDKKAEINATSKNQKNDEINNIENDPVIPLKKSKKGNLPKTPVNKINLSMDSSGYLEIAPSETNDLIVQNSEDDTEQNPTVKSNVITIQFFEEVFLTDYLNSKYENKEMIELWTKFMEQKFPDKTEVISFSKLESQFKYKPFSRKAMFDSESEIKKLIKFFKNYNQ
jgi:hypothetical protein